VILLGPGTLAPSGAESIRVRAPVLTRDGHHVGQVHRIVLDLEQQAVADIVVLAGGLLARDILVPIDFVDHSDEDEVVVRLTRDELDQLPNFTFNEFITPPPTWTSFVWLPGGPVYIPVEHRKRLAPTQRDVTPGTKVLASDGEIGHVKRVELDPTTAAAEAVWVTTGGARSHELRIPIEWFSWDDGGGLRVPATRDEAEAYLGRESRALFI
jgi:sporulation protein YlmC with PRC-barrel domain